MQFAGQVCGKTLREREKDLVVARALPQSPVGVGYVSLGAVHCEMCGFPGQVWVLASYLLRATHSIVHERGLGKKKVFRKQRELPRLTGVVSEALGENKVFRKQREVPRANVERRLLSRCSEWTE